MGKFISSDFQTTRARPTPPTLLYLGAGLLFAAEAHSVICSPFSETSFLPQLSDTDHSFLCSASKHRYCNTLGQNAPRMRPATSSHFGGH